MIALADCNSFFCSVEKVFHPGLDEKPVCVLSCYDGCIVALTTEAKAIGLHRGDPIFKMRDIVEHNNVKLFSTNMYLYAAMSKRVNNILRAAVPHTESYSIDESFLYLDGMEKHLRGVAEKVKLYTDIPVSVGVAPSKTLAKMGSKFAKQYKGYRSVCMIDTEDKRRKALELFDLSDVWGVGRRTFEKLNYYGIHTALQFADKSESWVRSHFNLPTIRTWRELNGIPCIDTAEVIQNQSICTSRSFGEMVTDLSHFEHSIATFAGSCANKLRGQRSVATTITVFITSNRFREYLQQYANAQTLTLPVATSDTLEITKGALSILREIYQPGICYKKSGVILSGISNAKVIQQSLFDQIKNRPQRKELMNAIDDLNHRYGLKSIRLAVEGEGQLPWQVKCEHRSGNYLSNINEILTINI